MFNINSGHGDNIHLRPHNNIMVTRDNVHAKIYRGDKMATAINLYIFI